MALVLGIDGGGSGCRAALADATGRVLGRGEAGPANIHSDFDAALANILRATEAALAEAGAGIDTIVTAVLGLAGANLPELAEALARRLPFPARVISDALTAAHGALGPDDGIVAAIGTGSVFVRRQGPETRMIGGHGFLLGDEGSGAVLGRSLLQAALRAEEGRAPLTPLLCAVLEELGGPNGLMTFARDARPADFAALAPRLIDSADPAAEAILREATEEVAAIIAHLQPETALPVVFLGGLGPSYATRLGARWPALPPRGSALDGALALALSEAARG
ncbi:BadF/BadG/BcrA/BcrD ATPase family protein [Pseudothioclava arenosa]|uniref:ATPase n=1 Tax=Pseudothioclava arenosa TaxID=1795308 RepID=A0A2A4CN64_9RHOB|nr:BadF/BadG/BcrA/BcrD ATPase family protein [Pseudothioclava arenosa]PCD75917.1 ATPase [Pseudothioclava arenosa]